MEKKEFNKNFENSKDIIKNKNQNVDFNQLFNVESEEKEIKEETSNPIEENNEVPTEENTPKKVEQKINAFNGEEKILYEIKPEKESSIVVPILFFVFLIATIFALPYISEKISFTSFTPIPTKPNEENKNEDELYYFNKSTIKAKKGDLEFTNFLKAPLDNEYVVSFTLKNMGNKTYQFDKKYYIVFYDENKIVYRALIHSYEAIGAMAATVIRLPINARAFNDADSFKIEEIKVGSYPKVKLVEEEGEYKVLDCNYNNNSIKYYFIDDELQKIKDVYKEEAADNNNFETNKETYKNLSNKFKQVNGFSSIFVENVEYFEMINEFELKLISDVSIANLRTYRFFKYKEYKDVVSFELEAQGYTCS